MTSTRDRQPGGTAGSTRQAPCVLPQSFCNGHRCPARDHARDNLPSMKIHLAISCRRQPLYRPASDDMFPTDRRATGDEKHCHTDGAHVSWGILSSSGLLSLAVREIAHPECPVNPVRSGKGQFFGKEIKKFEYVTQWNCRQAQILDQHSICCGIFLDQAKIPIGINLCGGVSFRDALLRKGERSEIINSGLRTANSRSKAFGRGKLIFSLRASNGNRAIAHRPEVQRQQDRHQ